MSNRYAQVVVLAEDERSANLVRRYIMRALHLDNRRIRQLTSPSAKGDAKQWVIGRYPAEVKSLRGRHPKTGLIVHLDADLESVDKRTAQLADALKASGLKARDSSERICHFIPRRNTETWLCSLTGLNVDEQQNCKWPGRLADFDAVVQQAALALYQLARPNVSAPALPSIAAAIAELQRLES